MPAMIRLRKNASRRTRRQKNAKSSPGRAVDFDASAVAGHDGMRDRQSQPRALADILRRKERIEDAGQHVGCDPRSIVLDFEPNFINDSLRSDEDFAPLVRMQRLDGLKRVYE